MKQKKIQKFFLWFLVLLVISIWLNTTSVSYAQLGLGEQTMTEHLQETLGEDFQAKKPNVFERILAGTIKRIVGSFFLIVGDGLTIDKLVFNRGLDPGYDLLIISAGDIGNFFRTFYYRILYIFLPFIFPVAIWTAIHFFRIDGSAESKKNLIERLRRLVMSLFWIAAMPTILDILLTINNAFVGIFSGVITSLTGSDDAFLFTHNLIDVFASSVFQVGLLLSSIMMFVVAGLSLFLAIYYFIRNLTISFLFLIFPIIAIFHPFNKDITYTWFKEITSNIFTQSIHAVIFTVIIGMAHYFSQTTMTVGKALFITVAFALTFPFTSQVKKLFNMEGNIGGASSMAGLGMAMGAFALGKIAINSIGRAGSTLLESNRLKKEALADQAMLDNQSFGKPSTGGIQSASSQGPTQLPQVKNFVGNSTNTALSLGTSLGGISNEITQESIDAKLRESRRLKSQAAGRLAMGALGGVYGAAFTSSLGLRPALVGGTLGMYAGGKAGEEVGSSLGNFYNQSEYMVNFEDEIERTALLDNITKEQAEAKLLGLGTLNPGIANSDVMKKEMKARYEYNKLMAANDPNKARMVYAQKSPIKQRSQQEWQDLERQKGLYKMVNENMSIIYAGKENSPEEILAIGKGDSSLEKGSFYTVPMTVGHDHAVIPKAWEQNIRNSVDKKAQEYRKSLEQQIILEGNDPAKSRKEIDSKVENFRNAQMKEMQQEVLSSIEKMRKEFAYTGLSLNYHTEKTPFKLQMQNEYDLLTIQTIESFLGNEDILEKSKAEKEKLNALINRKKSKQINDIY